uniref:Ovule protein n=1 Tax=Haemonchus placei TaxID=6290 RepID=A0A0N4WVB7_HAEPC
LSFRFVRNSERLKKEFTKATVSKEITAKHLNLVCLLYSLRSIPSTCAFLWVLHLRQHLQTNPPMVRRHLPHFGSLWSHQMNHLRVSLRLLRHPPLLASLPFRQKNLHRVPQQRLRHPLQTSYLRSLPLHQRLQKILLTVHRHLPHFGSLGSLQMNLRRGFRSRHLKTLQKILRHPHLLGSLWLLRKNHFRALL